jgi:dihydroorotase/N-acyl-D-amino-acid deacylase
MPGVAAPAATMGSAAACRAAAPANPASAPFDTIIEHGHIIDGTGSPWYSGQVGIRAGRIAAIGHLDGAPRRQTIDAQGHVVAPGFIDMLGQSELTILVDPRLPSKIFQGITTEITGEGSSVAPLNAAMIAANRAGYEHLKFNPASASTWQATSGRPACAGWCSAMPTRSRTRANCS